MAPPRFNFTNILKYTMSASPMFISAFLLLASLLNQNVKGLIYIGGILVVALITVAAKQLFKMTGRPDNYDPDVCQMFDLPQMITQYSAPDFNSSFLAFTTLYLIMPMAYGAAKVNAILIIFLSICLIGNAFTRVTQQCNKIIDILIGIILGGGLGVGYFYIFWMTGNKHLLFTDDIASNNVTCDRPSKQTFKCAVYKNGELVKNL